MVKEKKEGKKRKLHADGGKKVSSISNATGATNLAAEAAKVVKEVSGHGGTFRTDANSNRVVIAQQKGSSTYASLFKKPPNYKDKDLLFNCTSGMRGTLA